MLDFLRRATSWYDTRMSKVVTVMNMKGGVGKTTLSLHLGAGIAQYILANKTRRVLLIDYDPQFNLSQALLDAKTYYALERQKKTCLSILQDDDTQVSPFELKVPGNHTPPPPAKITHRAVSYQGGTYLDIVPSTLNLMYLALGNTTSKLSAYEERFEKFIALCRPNYDLILIDCHPAGSILTRTSLRASDHVIIPVAPQPYAIRGIGLMKEFVEASQQSKKVVKPHILFNMVPRGGPTPEETQIRQSADLAPMCFVSTFKKFKAFAEPMGGQNLVWNSKKPYSGEAKQNLIAVMNEVITRVGL